MMMATLWGKRNQLQGKHLTRTTARICLSSRTASAGPGNKPLSGAPSCSQYGSKEWWAAPSAAFGFSLPLPGWNSGDPKAGAGRAGYELFCSRSPAPGDRPRAPSKGVRLGERKEDLGGEREFVRET